jgi:hypothetical protein
MEWTYPRFIAHPLGSQRVLRPRGMVATLTEYGKSVATRGPGVVLRHRPLLARVLPPLRVSFHPSYRELEDPAATLIKG